MNTHKRCPLMQRPGLWEQTLHARLCTLSDWKGGAEERSAAARPAKTTTVRIVVHNLLHTAAAAAMTQQSATPGGPVCLTSNTSRARCTSGAPYGSGYSVGWCAGFTPGHANPSSQSNPGCEHGFRQSSSLCSNLHYDYDYYHHYSATAAS